MSINLLCKATARQFNHRSCRGTALAVEGIHRSDSRLLGMQSVGDSITDHVLKENLADTTGILMDEMGDTFDASTMNQMPDSWLGDALDIITEKLAVTLSACLSEPLVSLATSSHADYVVLRTLFLPPSFYTKAGA